jgi:hypothetical protein
VIRHILLIGRTAPPLEAARSDILAPNLEVRTGTGYAEVISALEAGRVDHLIMGAGIDLEERIRIVRAVFERSDTTTVHLKDRASGQAGMGEFVRSVLAGLALHR